MFFCCCPQKKSTHQETLLPQSLQNGLNSKEKIEKNNKLEVLDQTYSSHMKLKNRPQSSKKKLSYEKIKRSFPHQQKSSQSYSSENDNKNRSQDEKSNSMTKSQKTQSNKKFMLWKQEEKSDIIFYNTSEKCPCLLSFFLKKKCQKINVDSLDHVLKKSLEKFNAIISNDFYFQSKYLASKHFSSVNNVYIQMTKTEIENRNIEIIKSRKISAIRFGIFDQIIILTSKMDSYEMIKKICSRITQNLSFEELKNVIYIFPGKLKIYEIASIVFKSFYKFIVGEPVQKIISDLTFDMELIDNGHLGSTVIIKNRVKQIKQQSRKYDQRKLTIPLLLVDHKQITQKLHRSCYWYTQQKKFHEFLSYIDELRKQPEKILNFVDTMNEIIEKNKLQEVFLEKGNYCVISKKTKESITKHNPQNKKNEKIIIPDSDTPGKPDQLWEAELLKKFGGHQKSEYSDSEGRSCLQRMSDDEIDDVDIGIDLKNMSQEEEEDDSTDNNFEMEVKEKDL